MQFLAKGEVPADAPALARVIRGALYIRLDRSGRLWVRGAAGGADRVVPPIVDRVPLVRRTLEELGHPGGQRLYTALRS